MKIISKHRDYYDHLVSYYGYDETRVYDRREQIVAHPSAGQNLLHICGVCYPIVKKRDNLYFSESKDLEYWDNSFLRTYKGAKSWANQKFRQPVLIKRDNVQWNYYKPSASMITEGYVIPILSNFKIPSIIDAHEMYQMVYNFLGWLKDNPEPPNTQTDKDKIIAHGFDVKSSFRPKIK